jgi:hypothetical protein
MRRSVLAVVVLAMTGAAGCSGGGGIAVGDYLDRLVEAHCQYDVRCGLFTDLASCEAFFTLRDDPSLAAAIDAGKSSYDADKAEQCVNQIANADCDRTTKEGRETPAVCSEVVTGTVQTGDACASSSECVSGACATPTCGMACCLGTCVAANAPAKLGEPCATRTCEVGLACDNAKMCVELLAAGAPCTSGDQCAYGLGCAGSPGTCKALPKVGEPCPDNVCTAFGATCSAGTCIADGLPGAPCTVGTDCSPFYTCDATAHQCAAYPTLGMPCNTACSDDSWCNIPSGSGSGTCDAPQADGAACSYDVECTTHFCDSSAGAGRCAEPAVCI